jgi:hypothetical protein
MKKISSIILNPEESAYNNHVSKKKISFEKVLHLYVLSIEWKQEKLLGGKTENIWSVEQKKSCPLFNYDLCTTFYLFVIFMREAFRFCSK